LALFIMGAYAEAKFHISPYITAAGNTGAVAAKDLYTGFIHPYMGKARISSLVVSVAGFSALLLFKHLFRTGKL